jgi:hypothetical protein
MKCFQIVIGVVLVLLSAALVFAKTMSNKPVCGIENCHGLTISCGPNVPEACTAMYALGDFCREFAQCQVVDGSCQFVPSTRFQSCKGCVEDCQKSKDPLRAFECEHQCRELFPSEKE